MFCPISQSPKLRPLRAALSRLLPLAVLAALGACDGGNDPMAPTSGDDALPPENQSVAPVVDGLAALTAPQIAFMSYRYNNYPNLFLMDASGQNVVRRTNWTGDAGSPAWSHDNKRIAMIRGRLDASNVRHEDIYLMNADGTNKHWARSLPSNFSIVDPSWSPDGSRLVVTVYMLGSPYLATLELATGQLALVKAFNTTLVPGRYGSYDPTGKTIIYIGPTGKTVDGVSATQWYTLVSSATPVGNPSFSRDGKKFAYDMVVGSNNTEIYVGEFSTIIRKRLTNNSAYDGAPTWSPDGTKLAFVSTRSGQQQIWTMSSTTGGGLTRITFGTAGNMSPAFSH